MIRDSLDLYDSKNKFERNHTNIKDWDTSDKNKKFVNLFFEHCGAEGLSYKRRLKYLNDLKGISTRHQRKDFDKVTKDDTTKFMNKVRGMDYSKHTINDYIKSLKKFYKVVFGDNEEIPDKFKFIRSLKKISNGVRDEGYKEQPITPEEIKEMLNTSTNIRDKVLISLVFEGCLRPSEALDIKVKDLNEIEGGYKVNVYGKTGFRPIFLYQTAPYIRELLKISKKKQEDYLFTTDKNEKISYSIAKLVLKRMMFKTNIKKKNNLYWLRHSGITYKRILGVSDGALSNFAGWVAGSNQLKIYSHLSGEECRDEIAELYGIKNEKKVKELIQKFCPICKTEIGFADSFCGKCGHPLSDESLEKKEKLSKIALDIMDTSGKDRMEALRNIIREEMKK